jgi:hypothetical protein
MSAPVSRSTKPATVLELFEQRGFEMVVIADTDTAWMRDPRPFLASHPTADAFVSSDCLSHAAEEGAPPPRGRATARCGHVPGGEYGMAGAPLMPQDVLVLDRFLCRTAASQPFRS